MLAYQVRDRGRDTVVPCEGVLLRPLVQRLDQFGGEPSLVAVQLAHPAVLVALRDDGDDVVLPEAQLVVVPSLKVDHRSADATFFRVVQMSRFQLFINENATERHKVRRGGIKKGKELNFLIDDDDSNFT